MATQNDIIDMLINMSQQRFQQTNPIFQALSGRSAEFLGVPINSVGSPVGSTVGPSSSGFDEAGFLNAIKSKLQRETAGLGGGDPFSIVDPPVDELRKQFPDLASRFIAQPQQSGMQPGMFFPGGSATFNERTGQQSPILGVRGVGGDSEGLGRLDVTQSPMFGALKTGAESQFGRARENILSTIPRGGQLLDALSGLETDKARFMTGAIGGLAQDELNRALQLLGIGDSSAFGGTTNAANLLTQLQAAQAQRRSAADQALGSGIGTLLGIGLGSSIFCWVAEELYGKSDHRTRVVRYYVKHHVNDKTLFGSFCRLYRRYGQIWARIVKSNSLVRLVARWIWDSLYRFGLKELSVEFPHVA